MDREKLNLLLVDDNFMMLKMMMPMLEQLGFRHFVLAENGRMAWRKLNGDEEIHLVLSDLIMPQVDGIELLLKIRDSEKFWDLPFVMITGEENQNQLMSSIEIDVNSYILKPFTPEKLDKEITAVLNERYHPSPFHKAMQQGRRLLIQEARHQEAMRCLEEAKRLGPRQADPCYFSALVHERRGDYPAAKEELKRCIALKEAHTKAYDMLALIHRREENYAAEREVLAAITELSPDNLERNINLAAACARCGDEKAMKEFLQRAARLARKKRASFERIFRGYLLREGHAADAEGVYRRYIDRSFDQPRLLNKYALIFKEYKEFDHAIAFLERIEAIRRGSRNHGIPPEDMAVFYFNLAVALVEKAMAGGTAEEKKAACEKAVTLVNKSIDCAPGDRKVGRFLSWLEDHLQS